jgi:hypothetical protein
VRAGVLGPECFEPTETYAHRKGGCSRVRPHRLELRRRGLGPDTTDYPPDTVDLLPRSSKRTWTSRRGHRHKRSPSWTARGPETSVTRPSRQLADGLHRIRQPEDYPAAPRSVAGRRRNNPARPIDTAMVHGEATGSRARGAGPLPAHKHRERRGEPRRPECPAMLNAASRDGVAWLGQMGPTGRSWHRSVGGGRAPARLPPRGTRRGWGRCPSEGQRQGRHGRSGC